MAQITYRKKLRGSKNDPEKLGKTLAKDLLESRRKTNSERSLSNSEKQNENKLF
ncbi:MAG: hypothetical protein MZV64_51020 [Ignavibacteriales bacterium]|nr:hypothetical protein [Ignavibacteriales bacterium]